MRYVQLTSGCEKRRLISHVQLKPRSTLPQTYWTKQDQTLLPLYLKEHKKLVGRVLKRFDLWTPPYSIIETSHFFRFSFSLRVRQVTVQVRVHWPAGLAPSENHPHMHFPVLHSEEINPAWHSITNTLVGMIGQTYWAIIYFRERLSLHCEVLRRFHSDKHWTFSRYFSVRYIFGRNKVKAIALLELIAHARARGPEPSSGFSLHQKM